MREVEVTRFVPLTIRELERVLSPRELIEYEGTFTVDAVTERAEGDGWHVTATAGGVEAAFHVTEREDGYQYEQVGQQGPFESMATTLSMARRNEGSDVSLRSTVSLGLPLAALTDRVAAWKRRGELERAVDALVAAAEAP